jgi:hypothetical protein
MDDEAARDLYELDRKVLTPGFVKRGQPAPPPWDELSSYFKAYYRSQAAGAPGDEDEGGGAAPPPPPEPEHAPGRRPGDREDRED